MRRIGKGEKALRLCGQTREPAPIDPCHRASRGTGPLNLILDDFEQRKRRRPARISMLQPTDQYVFAVRKPPEVAQGNDQLTEGGQSLQLIFGGVESLDRTLEAVQNRSEGSVLEA